MPGSKDELAEFYGALQRGLTVEAFLPWHKAIIAFVHSRGLTQDYARGRGRVKPLRDEVTPVARFVKVHSKPSDRVSFAISNTFPDCVLHRERGPGVDIEVTRVTEHELKHWLQERGGLVELAEDDPDTDVWSYSTDQIIHCIENALSARAERKKSHRGHIMLVESDMLVSLADERWPQFRDQFTEKVIGLHFEAVYLTGRSDADLVLKIR